MNEHGVKRKWRPSLAMIVIGMLVIILSLPFAGIWLFKFYDAQLVRETEAELISQSAALSSVMTHFIREKNLIETLPEIKSEKTLKRIEEDKFINPILPKLNLATDEVLPPRPDAAPTSNPSSVEFSLIGAKIFPIVRQTQKTTLAGFRVLDPYGNVIAGHENVGLSLAHIKEVKDALSGDYSSVLRQRISDKPLPALASLSRGTRVRVFITMPIIVDDKLGGVLYLSRTPSNVLKELYQQRKRLMLVALITLLVTLSIAYIFIRTIKTPIDRLRMQSRLIGKGDREAIVPNQSYGTREIAELSQTIQQMSQKLFDRSDYINTFAVHVSHELKSPLTSIQGAAELLRDQADNMPEKQRNRFLDNIIKDTDRSVLLLERLRDLAKADNPVSKGSISVEKLIEALKLEYPKIKISQKCLGDFIVGMAPENALIVVSNLVENAVNHEADHITINTKQFKNKLLIGIHDNGSGISKANSDKIFELFFTTRREEDGTGMGLGIVQALLKAHQGKITLKSSSKKQGTLFEIELPSEVQKPSK